MSKKGVIISLATIAVAAFALIKAAKPQSTERADQVPDYPGVDFRALEKKEQEFAYHA